MKILVTGAGGFIGSYICSYYVSQGHQVVGVVHNDNDELKCETVKYDLLECEWTDLLDSVKPQMIIHCAGMADVSYSVRNPLKDFESNTTMVYKMLHTMQRLGMQDTKVIFLSSAGVYGQPLELPIKENAFYYPKSPYALHKQMAEDICHYFVHNHGFQVEILRIFSAYGPGLRKQIFWDMYQQIKKTRKLELWGTGNESRDYIYITDLIRAIELISNNTVYKNTVWNVANGKEVTIKHVAKIFLENFDSDVSNLHFRNVLREGDPQNWKADISRLTAIGYQQMISIEEGIEKYTKWLKCGDNR